MERMTTMSEDDAQQLPDSQPDRATDNREELRRGLVQDLGTHFLDSAAIGAGLQTGSMVGQVGVEKIKDIFTPKDEGAKIELPPGTERE
jgi:hypothetical protein